MPAIKHLPADQAIPLIARYPALVIGPAATAYRGAFADLARALVARLRGLALPEHLKSYLALGDVVATLHEAHTEAFQSAVKDEVSRLGPSADLKPLADVNWTACVAITPDTLFETALSNRLDRQATSRTLTILSGPNVSLPPRTIPVYRLFGTAQERDEDSRLALSNADILFRSARWPSLVATLPDAIKDSPLLFVGTEDVADLTAQFIACIFAGPRPHPGRLLFLEGDPTPSLPVVNSVLQRAGVSVLEPISKFRNAKIRV
jgi:hypothetical protein